MKKIQFYRNEQLYVPSNGLSALQVAKNSVMERSDTVDGEIILARYQEDVYEGINTLICIYHDGWSNSGWTFIGGIRGEIEETEEVIAQALSDLDTRIISIGTSHYTKLETDNLVKDLDKVPYTTATPAANVTIQPYKMYDFGTVSTSMTIAFNTSKEVSGYTKEYMIRFVAGSGCSITLPNSVIYANGSAPTYTSGHTYEINVVNGCAAVGEFY